MTLPRRISFVLAVVLLLPALFAACSFLPETQDAPLSRGIVKIAILPVAFVSADEQRDCDLCPSDLKLSPTSREQADLVTAFLYEAFGRHPAYHVLDHGLLRDLQGFGMKQAAQRLS